MSASSGCELPERDLVLDELPVASRELIASVWRRRARNELRTSSVFASLHRELMAFGADFPVLSLSSAAVGDEVRHAQLCVRVAERYAGESFEFEPVAAVEPPSFSVCSRQVERALFAALQCSVNETLATGFLGACLEQARGAVARHALRALLTDEVRHARIGWAVLASPRLSAADRGAVAEFMPALLHVCVGAWLTDDDTLELEQEIPEGHGNLASPALQASVDDMLRSVIVPGLEHVAIDSRPARSWLEEHMREPRPSHGPR